ncbi:MAG: YceI family protein [Chitinophagaceae bacterium]|nr:YceI family protein [Chitinophagaceae bacterium]
MKNLILIAAIIVIGTATVTAQKVYTKNGLISFYSTTKMEDIKANNNQTLSVLNTQNGDFQFSVLNKGFHFEKALMEEHFNENYMESSKFPKSTFKGAITDLSKVDFKKDGTYNVTVKGDLAMHGVTKNILVNGVISIKEGKITASSKFSIKLSDFNISIPGAVKGNIAEAIDITVNCKLDQKM